MVRGATSMVSARLREQRQSGAVTKHWVTEHIAKQERVYEIIRAITAGCPLFFTMRYPDRCHDAE